MASGSVNKVIIIGNTGDDVKMHYFDDSNCIGRFPVATSEEYVNKTTNERVTNTEWHSIIVRNKAAEICEKYLKKGDKVYLEGRLKTRKWTDDKGNDRYTTEIHCTEFTFLTPKGQKPADTNAQPLEAPQSKNKTAPQVSEPDENNEDDLPF
jgi:single-strand DNA-binding protein